MQYTTTVLKDGKWTTVKLSKREMKERRKLVKASEVGVPPRNIPVPRAAQPVLAMADLPSAGPVSRPSLDTRTDPPGFGPTPPPVAASASVATQAPVTYAFPAQKRLPLGSAQDVRTAVALFLSVTASDGEKAAAWAAIAAAGQQYGVPVPPSWSSTAGMYSYSETTAAREAINGIGLVRDRATEHAMATRLMAERGISYAEALLEVGAQMAATREVAIEQAAKGFSEAGAKKRKRALELAERLVDSVGLPRSGELVRDNAKVSKRADKYMAENRGQVDYETVKRLIVEDAAKEIK